MQEDSRKERIIQAIREREAEIEHLKRGKVIIHVAGKEMYIEISGGKEKI